MGEGRSEIKRMYMEENIESRDRKRLQIMKEDKL